MHSGCPHLRAEAHQVAHLLERGSRARLPTLWTRALARMRAEGPCASTSPALKLLLKMQFVSASTRS